MRKSVKLVLAVVVVVLLALPLSQVAAQAKGDAKAGKLVYDKKCAACHGPNGEGKPALAKALKVEIRDLGAKEVQSKTDEQLRKESVEGIGKMKAVPGMSEKEIQDLMAFLRSLARK